MVSIQSREQWITTHLPAPVEWEESEVWTAEIQLVTPISRHALRHFDSRVLCAFYELNGGKLPSFFLISRSNIFVTA